MWVYGFGCVTVWLRKSKIGVQGCLEFEYDGRCDLRCLGCPRRISGKKILVSAQNPLCIKSHPNSHCIKESRVSSNSIRAAKQVSTLFLPDPPEEINVHRVFNKQGEAAGIMHENMCCAGNTEINMTTNAHCMNIVNWMELFDKPVERTDEPVHIILS